MKKVITIDDFRSVVKYLVAAYPQEKFIPDEYTFNVWYSHLCGYSKDVLERAAMSYVMSNRFSPRISDIVQLAYDLSAPPDDIPAEEWNRLFKELRYASGTDAKEHWNALPEITKQIVGGFAQFAAWSNTPESDLITVQRPMFVKRYESILKANRQRNAVPVGLRKPVKAIAAEQFPAIEQRTRNAERAMPPDGLLGGLRDRLNGVQNKG